MNMIQGGVRRKRMEYRIILKEPFRVVGIKQLITFDHERKQPSIEQMHDRFSIDDIQAWNKLSTIEPRGILGATIRLDHQAHEGIRLEHYIGVATSENPIDLWDVLEIPALTWIVFTICGALPDAMQTLYEWIYMEWLPQSPYQFAEGPQLLRGDGTDYTSDDYLSQLWMPIELK